MVPGNPRHSGVVFEKMLTDALEKGGYSFVRNVIVGKKPDGSRYKVDLLVDNKILVSVKWQQTSGTAEQKIPFEVIALTHLFKSGGSYRPPAYLVLGGNGWRTELKEFYLSRDFLEWIPKAKGFVVLVDGYDFIKLVNERRL
ncbi:MAG: hypothetical protein KatS3mg087_0003 [Patescibacteria group bacterium]|nr:MAG: hypothetical protein KatS3mg087_0003 [Patescibacteria group bacterium]